MHKHTKWVSEIFDRAAPQYGQKSSSFFTHFGKQLVNLVEIPSSARALDVATGRGAVLFPLADAVGPLGQITGIDISQQMIQQTLQDITQKNIHWVTCRQMDAEQLDFPDHTFDAVFCGFALFFFPSLSTALSEFKRVLKPGGTLAVSTWGENSALDAWIYQEVNLLSNPTSLTTTPLWSADILRQHLDDAGFHSIQTPSEIYHFTHRTAEEWWDSLWNHGTRAKLEQLAPHQIIDLRTRALQYANRLATDTGIDEALQVFYGIAQT